MSSPDDPTMTSYSGKARILDRNGMLLDVGTADLTVTDEEAGHWRGTLRVFAGSCLQSMSLTVVVECDAGSPSLAQVGPPSTELGSDLLGLTVVGIGPPPF